MQLLRLFDLSERIYRCSQFVSLGNPIFYIVGMKKSITLLTLFCAAAAFAASPKISKTCSQPKKAEACLEELSALAQAGKLGDTAAIALFAKTVELAQKNRAFLKPLTEKVDSLVWEPCKKKEREACLAACVERTDSSFARIDAPDSLTCAQAPQKLIQKKVKVSRPNPILVSADSLALDAFWNSSFEFAPAWFSVLQQMNKRVAISDSLFPDLNSAREEISKADSADFAFQKKFFKYCAIFKDSLAGSPASVGQDSSATDSTAVDSTASNSTTTFHCPELGTFTDPRDGKIYRTERFGEKFWTIDNANFEVPEISACYDGDSLNCEKFGRLYTFEAAKSACPEGFRVATDEDFSALSPKETAEFAVTVRFGGYFNQSGICTLAEEGTYFWTSTEEDASRGFVRNLFSDANALEKASVDKKFGLSVRCVQE